MTLRPIALCHDCEFGTAEGKFPNTYSCIALERLHEGPSHCAYYSGPRRPIDVVVITAVREEYNAVRKYLHCDGVAAWEPLPTASDGIWQTSTFCCNNKYGTARLRVALVQLTKMGLPAAASMAALAIQIFKPSLVAMVGMTAGRKGKTKIGDIIVPFDVWDYGEGKWSDRQGKKFFQQRIRQHNLVKEVRDRVNILKDKTGELDQLAAFWIDLTEAKAIKVPEVLTDPMVSGAAVVNSKEIWDEVTNRDDKIIAIEMEAYGVIQAVQDAAKPPYVPQCLIAKAVCDYGFKKNKKFQSYAAYTSVCLLKMYLTRFSLELDSVDIPCRANIPWHFGKDYPLVQAAF